MICCMVMVAMIFSTVVMVMIGYMVVMATTPYRQMSIVAMGRLVTTLSTVVLATIFYAVVMVMIRIFLARDMDVMS